MDYTAAFESSSYRFNSLQAWFFHKAVYSGQGLKWVCKCKGGGCTLRAKILLSHVYNMPLKFIN